MATSQKANPLATSDQTEVTARALRILEFPEVTKARACAEMLWKAVLQDDPPQEAWSSFDSMMDDYTFNYALKAANSDPNHPKVVHVYTPPHQWRGMSVPGSRWGGDNPDAVYRIIPIDNKARFRLAGRQIGDGPSDVTYTLVGNWETSKTLNGIEHRDLEINPDGTFSIPLDPQPANGRSNHIQTKPGALLLFIRDAFGDWDQIANALTIHRLDPPDSPPLSDQQIAERAADILVGGIPQVYWFLKFAHRSPNDMPPFLYSGEVGGLQSQRGNVGQAILADDEAWILTVNTAGAAYSSVTCHNYWWITRDYAEFTSCRTNAQSVRNADGTVTYVVSIKDPGVHNWIDTAGLHDVIVNLRLQGLPREQSSEPWVTSKLVKLAELKNELPKETKWVTQEERAAEIDLRRRQVEARMSDH